MPEGGFYSDSITIVPKTVTTATVELNSTEIPYVSYDPEDYELAETPVVKVDDVELEEGKDFTYVLTSKEDVVEVGDTLTVAITFRGNYVGQNQTAKVTITSINEDLSNVKLIAPTAAESVYSGDPIPVKASDIGKTKVTYVVNYYKDGELLPGAPQDVGTYTAKVEAPEGFVGVNGESLEYTITPQKVSKQFFDLLVALVAAGDVEYNGENTKAPELTVLGEVTDQFEVVSYEKEWDGVAETGKAVIALTDGANYAFEGTAEKEYKWTKGWIDSQKLLGMFAIDDQIYDGTAKEPVPHAVDPEADDSWIKVLYYENNINAADKTAKAKVQIEIPENAKYAGYVEDVMVFAIKPAQIDEQFIEVEDAVYTGDLLEPKVIVKDKDGKALDLDKDYTLSYENNVEVGTGKVLVSGIKNYVGVSEKTFEIKKATPTVTAASKSYTYNGNPQNYNGGKVTGKTTGKLSYKFYSDSSCEKQIDASEVKDAGTYYVKAFVDEDEHYSAAESSKAKITIKKAAAAFKTVSIKGGSGKTKTYQQAALKKAGKSFQIKSTLSKGDGTVKYKMVSGSKSYFSVSSSGKVTVKKGNYKKGASYTIKVKCSVPATKNFKAKSVTVALKIKIK